jgi:hypothetical protein
MEGRPASIEFRGARAWPMVEMNARVLLEYWNGQIDYTEDVIDQLKGL